MDKIIACVDGSALNEAVCDAALWSAEKLDTEICFLHAIEKQQQHGADDLTGAIGFGAQSVLLDEMAKLDEEQAKLALQNTKAMLAAVTERARGKSARAISQKQRHGDLVDTLAAIEDETRVIVVGRCGEAHIDDPKQLGSHIESLVRRIHRPVMIVPPNFRAPRNFMLAYDGRDSANKALERILAYPLFPDLKCHLVMVDNSGSATKEKLDIAAQRLREKGYDVNAVFLEGEIFASLQKFKHENKIDFVMMGAFAHSKIRQFFLGSNTMRMIEHTDQPMLILH